MVSGEIDTIGELIRWKNSMDHHDLTLVVAGMREGKAETQKAPVAQKGGRDQRIHHVHDQPAG